MVMLTEYKVRPERSFSKVKAVFNVNTKEELKTLGENCNV